MTVTIELGLIYAIMALGVYLTFRILNFPDLTVDQSFTTGAATSAILIANYDANPLLALGAAFIAGALAGIITGLLHAKGGINPLLAGILTMLALYSINLRIMGDRANVPLLGTDTIYTWFSSAGITGWTLILVLAVIVLIVKLLLDWFLGTDMGLGLQATGDNEEMVRSFGVSTDAMKIVGLSVSNGLVGLAGAFIAQKQGSSDISMGIGLILIGLASVILGQAIFNNRFVTRFADTPVGRLIFGTRNREVLMATTAVILGSIIYRAAVQGALAVGFNPNDMRLISAIIVVAALLIPRWRVRRKPAKAVQTPASNSAYKETSDVRA
ncbi:MAG TPA: ABC transporter permease [Candidatus Yaniella excrementavium]|nr:ABC transporter permease [Candidatus Yaniella excrementavium]